MKKIVRIAIRKEILHKILHNVQIEKYSVNVNNRTTIHLMATDNTNPIMYIIYETK